ncbi:hypothetical protein AAHE18_19G031500 [Arachis hypogaea]
MAKLSLANVFLLILLVSVVARTKKVGGRVKCQAGWSSIDCEKNSNDNYCNRECKNKKGLQAYGQCRNSLCVCTFKCPTKY